MVKAGERYRHYKGKEVCVSAVCKAPVAATKGNRVAPWIDATSTDDIKAGEEIVVYFESGGIKLWARPLRIFEEVLGETTQFYRFTRIS